MCDKGNFGRCESLVSHLTFDCIQFTVLIKERDRETSAQCLNEYIYLFIWGVEPSLIIKNKALEMVCGQPWPPKQALLVACMAADRRKTPISSIPRHH